MKNLLITIFTIFLATNLASCGGGSESHDLSQNGGTTIIVQPVGLLPGFDFLPNPLSKSYDEYYSGYWRSIYSCGGGGKAILGISGSAIELNTGTSSSVFGEIDPDGNLFFNAREPDWSCETCGEVRPLETTGEIVFEENRATLYFEAACANYFRTDHTIVSVKIDLTSGTSQPHPRSEMGRIKNEAHNLIDASVQSCQSYADCRTFNIDKNEDFCNLRAKAYSIQVVDEEVLDTLGREYAYQKWLITNPGTSTTLCGLYYRDSCVSNVCIME
ncbi:MAG: hypothetical protein V2I38_14840 [Alcanivoracaceae bacterium]|nr:hypothetical protein [Alcanivoracaceae bacterium]